MADNVTQPELALEANRLTKRYGALTAIEDITFKVGPGEIVGFLGPNGAGKSTTLRILAGRLLATSGRATIWGESVALEPAKAKQHLAYMPENNPLPEDLRIREYLELRARLKGVDEDQVELRVDQSMHDCDLQGRAGMLIAHLSKGFRQRVGIADALLAEPKIILLDEPTIGLDPHQILGIRDLLRSLRGKMAVLISSHILAEVEQVCDRVIILNRGRIVAQGRTDELRRDLLPSRGHRVVAACTLAELERLTRAMDTQSTCREVRMIGDGWCEFRIILSPDSPARDQLLSSLVSAGLRVREVAEEQAGLEDIFLAATRRDNREVRT